tara:strand:+ start:5445 stop:5708 length:264 start_codon:yes stop_codon:yes gene_type:complete
MTKKAKKITEEQLNQLKEVVTKLNQVQAQIGNIETQKHELLHAFAEIQNDLQSTRKKLEEQYGDVTINFIDGTITEKEKNNALNKEN